MRAFFKPPVTGLHIVIGLTAFFVIVAAVNAVFIYLALQSGSGLETKNAYSEGLAYNDVLEQRQAQKDLGWQSSLNIVPASGEHEIVLHFFDQEDAPISGLDVTADLRRPTHGGYDTSTAFTAEGDGRYTARVAFALKGVWDAHIQARRGKDEQFYAEKRLWIE